MLDTASARLVEQHYTDSFGSWFFVFYRAHGTFRVVFDRRDRFLSLEQSEGRTDPNFGPVWRDISHRQLAASDFDSALAATRQLLAQLPQ